MKPIAAFIALGLVSSTLGQTIPEKGGDHFGTLNGIRATSTRLEIRKAKNDPELKQLLITMKKEISRLVEKWSNSGDAPEDYVLSLAFDYELLKDTLAQEDVEKIRATVRTVARDIALKLKDCEQSPGGAGRLITVLVRTKKVDREVGAFEVYYVPEGWSDVPRAYKRFDKVSSPTRKKLAPGEYLMWTREAGATDGAKPKEGEKKRVEIGGDRSGDAEIDLPAP